MLLIITFQTLCAVEKKEKNVIYTVKHQTKLSNIFILNQNIICILELHKNIIEEQLT